MPISNTIFPQGGSGGSTIDSVVAPLSITAGVLSVNNATDSSSGVVVLEDNYLANPSSSVAASTLYVSEVVYYKIDRVSPATPGNIATLTSDGSIEDSLVSITTDGTANNTTTVMTSSAVYAAIVASLVSGKSFRGGYNASVNTFPTTGGSGTAGAIAAGDTWAITTGGTLGGTTVYVNDTITALTAIPGQTSTNWIIANQKVSSVFSRTGAVVATSGDYSISQITNGLSNILSNGQIFQGNSSNLATAITLGGLTESTSSVLDITDGDSSVIHDVSIQVKLATTSQSGYISSTDWTTFNNKQSLLSSTNMLNPLYIGNSDSSVDAVTFNTLNGNSFNIYDQFISISGDLDSLYQNYQRSTVQSVITITDNTVVTLTSSFAYYQYITGTPSTDTTAARFNLPDATTMNNGDGFWLKFASSTAWSTLYNHAGTQLLVAQYINDCKIVLLDNSTSAGTWTTIQVQPRIWGSNLLPVNYIGTGAITNTEFNYLNGVTSNIQSQFSAATSALALVAFTISGNEMTPPSNYNLNLTKTNLNTNNYLTIGNSNVSYGSGSTLSYFNIVGNTGSSTVTLFQLQRDYSSSIANGATSLIHYGTGNLILNSSDAAGTIELQTSSSNRVTITTATTSILNALSGTSATFSTTLGVTGASTFSTISATGALTLSTNTNQIVLGTTNTTTMTMATLTASRTFTLPDANSNPVQPSTASANQFANAISSAGVISYAQPAFTNISGIATLAQGGTNANLAASNGGIFYSTNSAGAILAGTTTASQLLLSGSSTAPTWSNCTFPTSTTINQLLWSNATNTINGLVTVNSAMLTTTSGGAPSWVTTIPSALQTGITQLGSISSGTWGGTNIAVLHGGTGLSTTTAYGILCGGTSGTGTFQNAGAGSAGQFLISNGGAALPSFQQATLYYSSSSTYAIGDLIAGNGTNGVIGGIYCCNTASTTGTFTSTSWDPVIVSRSTASTLYNVWGGTGAFISATTASFCTAMGYQCLGAITTQGANTAFGYQAGQYVIGANNTWIGASAGKGVSGSSSATNNTGTGKQSGTAITTSSNNCLYGNGSGSALTSGSGYNYLFGVNSGSSITTGTNNTIIGSDPGSTTLANTFIVSSNNATPVQIINISGTNVTPAANLVLATPNGSTGAATLRSLVYADLTGGVIQPLVSTAISYTVLVTNCVVLVTDTTAARTITLPATRTSGQLFTIKDASGGANTNNITISGNGVNIDGASTKIISTAYGSIDVITDGTKWYAI